MNGMKGVIYEYLSIDKRILLNGSYRYNDDVSSDWLY
jgi:hypothetical protein